MSSNSNNNNQKEFMFYLRHFPQQQIVKTLPTNRQKLKKPMIGYQYMTSNTPKHVRRNVRASPMRQTNVKILASPHLSEARRQDWLQISRVKELGEVMELTHQIPYEFAANSSNIIRTPEGTRFHTNPRKSGHEKTKTKIVYILPVHLVETEGKLLLESFENTGNGYGYGTIEMPRELPFYVTHSNLNKNTGVRKIVAVLDPTLNQRQERIVNGFVFGSSNKKK